MTGTGRLALFLMLGCSLLLHTLAITGLPHLPWFSRPLDIYRLTRYVVRFARPTLVPMLTQAAVAEPIPIEPALVAPPLADLQTPKPIERVETLPEHAVESLVAPTPVQPVVPKPPELQQRAATRTRRRMESRSEQVVRPQAVPTPRLRPATQTSGRQAPSRAAAAVPPASAPVPTRMAALPQPRQPSREAILQAERETREYYEYYEGLIRQRLEAHSPYLREVTERSEVNGRVVLRFTVLSDGQVVDPQVIESVGHRTFRSAALRVLKWVGRLPPFPSEIRWRQILFEMPFEFRLEDR
jgi:protein TonB